MTGKRSGLPLRLLNVALFAAAFGLAIARQAWVGAAVTGVFLLFAIAILAAWFLQRPAGQEHPW